MRKTIQMRWMYCVLTLIWSSRVSSDASSLRGVNSGTRVKILRSHEDKVRFLNSSQVVKDNLFFGMRPILYVSRYSCNCPTNSGDIDPASASPSSSILDLPDFPPEDEVIPPSDFLPPPRLQEQGLMPPSHQQHHQDPPHLPSTSLPGSASPSTKIKETDNKSENQDEPYFLLSPFIRIIIFNEFSLIIFSPFILNSRSVDSHFS